MNKLELEVFKDFDKKKITGLNEIDLEVLGLAYSNPSDKWFEINYSHALARELKINKMKAWRSLNKLADKGLLKKVKTYPILFNPIK